MKNINTILLLIITLHVVAFSSWYFYKEYRTEKAYAEFVQGISQSFKSFRGTTDTTIKERKQKKASPVVAEISLAKYKDTEKRYWEYRRAFNAWYKKPPGCTASKQNPNPDIDYCVNHRLKAQQAYLRSH